MHAFEVWAPQAREMSVLVDGIAYPMTGPDERGYWRVEVAAAMPGSDYAFQLDRDPAIYPDPRSMWQPDGVHGRSRVYDAGEYVWMDAGFQAPPLASAIIYELHVGTFTPQGTLDSAIDKLDYLRALGITHVELMPVASFAGEYGWGYDGVALFAVHEPYGGPDALKRFVDAAHSKGLGVLLDVVYNHFGPVGNYTGKFGPYVTESHHTPWGGAVNLEDAGADEVRRFFCDNAQMWFREFHIDGLRLDAVHALVDRSAIHFLEQLSKEVEALSAQLARRLVLIAESDLNDPRIVASHEARGYGMDAQWSDDFHHALFAVIADETGGYYADFGELSHLAAAIESTFVYDGLYSKFRGRTHGRSALQISQQRFLGYIQNHDQIGNRAIGDRVEHVAGVNRAKIAAALVLTSPFVPMIFQGEEWAASSPFQYFANHDDPEMARLVSEGRKKEFAAFGWNPESIPDPEQRATYERSKLNWQETTEPRHAEMLAWYWELIRLRRSSPDLNCAEPGKASVAFDEQAGWMIVQRGSVLIYCNFSGDECRLAAGASSRVLLASATEVKLGDGVLILPRDAVAVIHR
jgi:maltooligosyltrehalose trehalohydrolase